MYRYMEGSKRYSLRWVLRQTRAVLILITLPLAYYDTKYRGFPWIYLLAALGLSIVITEFRHGKKKLLTTRLTIKDWLTMSGTNLFYAGFVICSGGLGSPLAGCLLIPAFLYTVEFGLPILLFHLPVIFILSTAALILSVNPVGAIIPFHLFTLLFFTVSLIVCLSNQSIAAHQDEKIRHLLTRDELTGLSNRRFLKAKMMEQNKTRRPYALVNLDINYFKYYNDQWGHSQGDILLIHVGKVLKKAVGEAGFVARYSGDEFMVFLPEIGEAEVAGAVRRIRHHLEEASFPGEECFPNHKLTVSFGTVCSSGSTSDCASLVVKADRALYQAKKNR